MQLENETCEQILNLHKSDEKNLFHMLHIYFFKLQVTFCLAAAFNFNSSLLIYIHVGMMKAKSVAFHAFSMSRPDEVLINLISSLSSTRLNIHLTQFDDRKNGKMGLSSCSCEILIEFLVVNET